IQLRSGRLIVPCDHKLAGGTHHKDPAVHFSHVIFSDDHGQSWRRGGSAGPGGNECEAVERADGSVMLNMRSYRGEGCRLVAQSLDGGETFSPARPDRTLVEPVCQASIRRIPARDGDGDGDGHVTTPGPLLFSNPATTSGRERLTIRRSDDEGVTWPIAKVLWEGPAAYSCLVALPDGRAGCFYERGDHDPYQ